MLFHVTYLLDTSLSPKTSKTFERNSLSSSAHVCLLENPSRYALPSKDHQRLPIRVNESTSAVFYLAEILGDFCHGKLHFV